MTTKKKTRKPRNFGLENGVTTISFGVNKLKGTVEFLGGPEGPNELWMSPKVARWLAEQLIEAANYLEQEKIRK